ncbi:MAG: YfhO family protein [Saccharofermentans sp.]|nr:YfhO family protein [Saccharofermentans sp.]
MELFARGGGDVFQILSFYCIGDPLALISVFFSAENMVICYNFLALLRCFLAGLALERLINEIKPSIGTISCLVGSVMYAFSFWIVYNITRHPSFVNPCIYFPLIIAGCEKIRNNKKPYYLIVAVALMATSNFYYFYMSVMLTVIYVIIRLGIDIKNRESRKAIKAAYKITIYSLIGALCAGITIVQAIRTFITDPRSEGAIGFSWVYPLEYYKSLISSIFYSNSTFYLCLGIGVPTIVAIILLFKGKDYLTLKIMWILSLIFILIPAIGQVFNGFGYITNRWSFAVAVIAAVTVALMWEDRYVCIWNNYSSPDLNMCQCKIYEYHTYSSDSILGSFVNGIFS